MYTSTSKLFSKEFISKAKFKINSMRAQAIATYPENGQEMIFHGHRTKSDSDVVQSLILNYGLIGLSEEQLFKKIQEIEISDISDQSILLAFKCAMQADYYYNFEKEW